MGGAKYPLNKVVVSTKVPARLNFGGKMKGKSETDSFMENTFLKLFILTFKTLSTEEKEEMMDVIYKKNEKFLNKREEE